MCNCIYVENKYGTVEFTVEELINSLSKEITKNSTKADKIKKEDIVKYAEKFIKENDGLTVSPKWIENILVESREELESKC